MSRVASLSRPLDASEQNGGEAIVLIGLLCEIKRGVEHCVECRGRPGLWHQSPQTQPWTIPGCIAPETFHLDGSISDDAEANVAKAGSSQLLIRTAVWD